MSFASNAPNIAGIQFKNQASAPASPASGYVQAYYKGLAAWMKRSDGSASPFPIPTPGGRLTLTTATPVTTADVTAAGTLYYTPYQHDIIWLYDGTSDWLPFQFAELSLSLTGFTNAKPYDIFAYNNSGTVALEALIWTNASNRATALVMQNGRLVKSGATTRLYLGTIYMSAASQCDDSVTKRFVWNQYNRAMRPIRRSDATASWSLSSASWRQVRATATNQVEVVVGVADTQTHFALSQMQSGNEAFGGIGIDSTTPSAVGITCYLYGGVGTSFLDTLLAVGYHAIVMCERGLTAAAATFYGTYTMEQTVLTGWVMQ